MLGFANRGHLCKTFSEIPVNFIGAENVIIDFETSSGSPTEMAVNPWRHCKILSFAITVNDCPDAYGCDARYTENFYQLMPQYIQDVLWYCKRWINHNVKYDVHVAINDAGIILPPWLELKCTLTQSKIIDSDRGGARGGYALDALCKNWLGHEINYLEDRCKLYLRGSKDYASIPPDILGEYNCQDVLEVRDLDKYIESRMPEHCRGVSNTEIELTKLLIVDEL